MSKRELIDCICEINKTAKPDFLAKFSEDELNRLNEAIPFGVAAGSRYHEQGMKTING